MSVQTNLKYTTAGIIHLYPFKFKGTVNIKKKFNADISIPCQVLARIDHKFLIQVMWQGKNYRWWAKQVNLLEYI